VKVAAIAFQAEMDYYKWKRNYSYGGRREGTVRVKARCGESDHKVR
jgi:hypothetical protein